MNRPCSIACRLYDVWMELLITEKVFYSFTLVTFFKRENFVKKARDETFWGVKNYWNIKI
jgi:hypothetical protein